MPYLAPHGGFAFLSWQGFEGLYSLKTILAVLIVAFLWFVPQLQGKYFSHRVPAKERPALVNEYRRTWAQIVGGFGLLLGLYFTWRRIEISQRELEATRDQQVTERFTRAIDQLGATDDKTGKPRLEIRLGGIYALERIARDSPKRDYSTVMEVLTAYVRENSRWEPKEASTPSAETNKDVQRAKEDAEHGAEPALRRLPADIQAILDVLKRREEHRVLLDLRGADLQGADLQGAILWLAKLQGAIFWGADLQGANFQEAELQGAKLTAAKLQGTNLKKVDFQGADLKRAGLERANFSGAKLNKADLQGANLQDAILRVADLQDAILSGAKLRGGDLRGANLSDVQGWTADQLSTAKTLEGATMPDGQKYKDWLTDKEGSGKDVENE